MKILLAGGEGYIGSHLYSQLEEIASVTSIDFDDGPSEKDCINLDLTDINQVKDFAYNCAHFDVLIFLVGLAHTKGSHGTQKEHKKINYQTLITFFNAKRFNY